MNFVLKVINYVFKMVNLIQTHRDIMQCNALIHWLASRLQTEDSSAKIKTLALIKNLANEGGPVFWCVSDAACFVYTCRRLIGLTLIAGTAFVG